MAKKDTSALAASFDFFKTIKTGDKFSFNSRKELSDFGFPPASVYACCLGKQKQSKGYTFERMTIE